MKPGVERVTRPGTASPTGWASASCRGSTVFLGGVLYRVPVPGLKMKDGAAHANLDTPGFVLRYTLDGSDPDTAASTYAEPVPLAVGQLLKIAAFTTTGRRGRIACLPGPAA
ncbi:MAG: chitobiase/beta-hexosaminidase C-terminal domain-containing protein [Aliidongia sp.]